jgi:DNA-binding transcriptional regulator YiaG
MHNPNPMSNVATVLKNEIARVARKQVRAELEPLKKAAAQYRSAIAAMKRDLAALERQVRSMGSRVAKSSPAVVDDAQSDGTKRRFSAPRLAAHRARLGLSAADYGRLAGVSSLSIYRWESGQVRPRAQQIDALARVRSLGKREVVARLG